MAVAHETPKACEDASLVQFQDAVQSGKWMAVYWSIQDGRVVMHRTTCSFPVADFPICIRQLNAELKNEIDGAEPEPLPLAPHLKVAEEDSKEDSKEEEQHANYETDG